MCTIQRELLSASQLFVTILLLIKLINTNFVTILLLIKLINTNSKLKPFKQPDILIGF